MYNSNPTHVLQPYSGGYYGSTLLLQPMSGLGGPLESIEMIPGVSWLNDKMPDAIPENVKTVVSLGLMLGAVGVAYGVIVKGKSIKRAVRGLPVIGKALKRNPKRRKTKVRSYRVKSYKRQKSVKGYKVKGYKRRARRNRR